MQVNQYCRDQRIDKAEREEGREELRAKDITIGVARDDEKA
jgi:hypothetical protein